MVLGWLICAGVVFLGASLYANGRNKRDRELRRLSKRAWKDACRARAAGDNAAYLHYSQLAQSLSIQRLQEAEQRARLDARVAQDAGRTRKAQRALAKADGLQRLLTAHYGAQPLPLPTLPVAQQIPFNRPPPFAPYAMYAEVGAQPAHAPMASSPAAVPASYAPAVAAASGPPASDVIYYQQQPFAPSAYPTLSAPPMYRPQPYTMPPQESSFSTSTSPLNQPLLGSGTAQS